MIKFIRLMVLFVATLLFAPFCMATEKQEIVETFFRTLQEKRYEETVLLFADELRFQCSEQQLSSTMKSIIKQETYIADTPDDRTNRENQSITGELQSFDVVKKTSHPNGALYESTLRFKNAVLQCHVAVDAGKIAAFEFLAVPNEPAPEFGETNFNNTVIGKILGYEYSIRVAFITDEGKKPEASLPRFMLLQKIDVLPSDIKDNGTYSKYWTSPQDGSHWQILHLNNNYSKQDYDFIKDVVFQVNGLPAGTYRVAFNNNHYCEDAKSVYFGLTDAISVGKENKNANVTQKLIHGGALRIHAVDVDSGEQIDNVSNDLIRQNILANFLRQHDKHETTYLFPGQYTFSFWKQVSTPSDRIYTPVEEKYEAEIVDGKESVIHVKLRSRPQTEEELNEHWKYIIKGTVQDIDGKPLPFAKITIMGFVEHRSGQASITADENGRYTFRFSKDMVKAIWSYDGTEQPTPEKPNVLQISVSAEHSGYVWKGIRAADGQLVSDQFLIKNEKRNGEVSRSDFHKMFCVNPEPTDEIKKKHNYQSINTVYPLQPTEINIVMQPSIHFQGVVQFDETPEAQDERQRGLNRAEVIFDLPRAERASYQPVFYGESDENFHFKIDVLPQDVGVQFGMSLPFPPSWKNDIVVAKTDVFKLPPAGNYQVVLYWKTETQHNARRHQLAVQSLTDADGKTVETEIIRPAIQPDFLFNRWIFTGILREDSGKPVSDAEVTLHRYNQSLGQNLETLKTDADGKFTVSEIKPYHVDTNDIQRSQDGEFLAVLFNKDEFLQKEQVFECDALLIFLSDTENPQEKTFYSGTISTERIVEPRKSIEFDFVLYRSPVIEGLLYHPWLLTVTFQIMLIGYNIDVVFRIFHFYQGGYHASLRLHRTRKTNVSSFAISSSESSYSGTL
ncbi:MAG: carboxypeptidase-like regulatory domain-containing protein [Planctomycetaceae bacterium]|nr:carboxypeptidase-like regulatory domain-containing protein [Planctomycetaceae bacterium]